MDHYDEKMNYSFEPVAPETPQPPLEQAKEEIRRSGKHTGLKIAALLAAVAIVAGVGGSALTKAIDAIGQKNLAEQESSASVGAMAEQSVEQEQPAAQKPQADASYRLERTPLPETLKSNEGDKALTPAQVYKMNIGAVCGISTQVTADLWGVETTGICTGSGFVLTEDGYIVTNHHVIADADEGTVVVQFYSGEEYPAAIVGTDSMNDIALLKIEAKGLQTVTVGDSDEVEVGETVEAIGNPLGDLTFTMTAGYISALDREIDTDGTVINMLQTDAAINSGNSGGALINDEGKVVGITVSSHSGGVPSYSVPIRYLNSLIGDGTAYSPGEYNRNHKPDASRCYSKHYPVPDFGMVTGVTLLGTIREGTTTTYYYDREEVEAGNKILLHYYAALGENTFYQFTGGSFTSSSTYPYSVKLYETSYDGIPAISVVVSSNSFASIGGLPQTVDFLLQEFVHYA